MAELTVSSGHTIAYHDSGSGEPIVFLHSFGHNRNMWYPQLTHFRELGYRVIAPDMPGHGDSPFVSDAHTVAMIGQAFCELLDRLGVKKTVVVGISIGGYIALSMWAHCPDLMSALVLCSSKAEADSDEIKARRRSQIENLRKNGLAAFVESGAVKRVSPQTAKERPWVVDWIKMMNYTVSEEANSATLEAMAAKEDDTGMLATISVPTLILSGAEDTFIPQHASTVLNRGIENSVHHVIDDAGHVASLENPTVVNGLIENFLNSKQRDST